MYIICHYNLFLTHLMQLKTKDILCIVRLHVNDIHYPWPSAEFRTCIREKGKKSSDNLPANLWRKSFPASRFLTAFCVFDCLLQVFFLFYRLLKFWSCNTEINGKIHIDWNSVESRLYCLEKSNNYVVQHTVFTEKSHVACPRNPSFGI